VTRSWWAWKAARRSISWWSARTRRPGDPISGRRRGRNSTGPHVPLPCRMVVDAQAASLFLHGGVFGRRRRDSGRDGPAGDAGDGWDDFPFPAGNAGRAQVSARRRVKLDFVQGREGSYWTTTASPAAPDRRRRSGLHAHVRKVPVDEARHALMEEASTRPDQPAAGVGAPAGSAREESVRSRYAHPGDRLPAARPPRRGSVVEREDLSGADLRFNASGRSERSVRSGRRPEDRVVAGARAGC